MTASLNELAERITALEADRDRQKPPCWGDIRPGTVLVHRYSGREYVCIRSCRDEFMCWNGKFVRNDIWCPFLFVHTLRRIDLTDYRYK